MDLTTTTSPQDADTVLSTQSSTTETSTHEPVLVTNVSYEEESRGYAVEMPVLHVRARRPGGEAHTFTVEGFRPSLHIRQQDFVQSAGDICNDRRVIGVVVDCSPSVWGHIIGIEPNEYDDYTAEQVARHLTEHLSADIYHDPVPTQSLEDDPLAQLIARVPGDVGGQGSIRSAMETADIETFEADIPFERRFLISTGVYRGMHVPIEKDRIRYESWPGEALITGDYSTGSGRTIDTSAQSRSVETATMVREFEPVTLADGGDDVGADIAEDIEPRAVIYDIEVATMGGGFPDVVQARNPITAIAAYDTYSEQYAFWGLAHESWADAMEVVDEQLRDELRERDDFPDADISIFDDETNMLEDFHGWVLERDPDIFTGWNAGGQRGGFDTPYLIQRSYNMNARRIRDYTETGLPGVWANEDSEGNRIHDFTLQDRCTLDLLDAYRKTQFRELDSYSLDDVAEAELGYGKTGLDHDELDDAWANNPVEFFAYNIRDTQATAEIERTVGLIKLFENLRRVTGAMYETAVNNGPMLDTMFLRRAHEAGLALPTNTEPDETVYHGAKVFDTEPGVHPNCVYPDLSSLYPSLMAMLNLGTETIVGDADALAASTYTEDDCFTFPVDERPFAHVPKGTSYGHVDRDQFKGVKTPGGEVREMFDPQYDWFYVLKPSVRESFIRDTVDELIDLKNQYSGALYSAVKRVTNSCYGVLGDSASGGVGFRLYDRRVAEGITLAGRLTITHTAEEFTSYINDHYDDEAILVGGDTDSSVTSIPNAPTLEHAWNWSVNAVEHVDASYDEFVQGTFGFDADDDHRLAVELESLASKLFFLGGDTVTEYRKTEDGLLQSVQRTETVKKRYAQAIVWDDDDGWLDTPDTDEYPDALTDPEDRSALKTQQTITYDDFEDGGVLSHMDPLEIVGVKGFELVRSDSAEITRSVQKQVLADLLLAKVPREYIEPYLQDVVDDIKQGRRPMTELARPKGVTKHPDDYGWKDLDELTADEITTTVREQGGKYVQTPGPTARGAKYADDHFDWENFEQDGSKPRKVPIKAIRNPDYPEVYQYDSYPEKNRPDSPEVGRPVDAIAVKHPDRIPDGFIIDYDTIIEKEVRDKVEPIITTVGMDWDDLLTEGEQAVLGAFA